MSAEPITPPCTSLMVYCRVDRRSGGQAVQRHMTGSNGSLKTHARSSSNKAVAEQRGLWEAGTGKVQSGRRLRERPLLLTMKRS